MAGISDEAFARYINQIGNATLEQIEAAQREQVIRARTGKPIALGDVLVEQGVLTAAMRENVEKKLIAQQQGGLKTLGNYKLIKKLGEGGMGAVYLAEDTTMLRKVALKVLPKKYASDPEFLTRFRREAKAAGKLNHVNIISAFTVGEEMGNHFYVMEYCEGEPLDKILKREQFLTWDRAVEIAMQIARGLQHAHEHGLIHRDIKPANIFIASNPTSTLGKGSDSGTAKILDLGLSKDIGGGEQSFNTQTGMALGTPHYISPEQAKGEKSVDGRTDIYSLGATLYHLITGQTPFNASTAAMIIMKHLTDQIPNPQDIRADIPDSVVQVIQKMMAKEAVDRYADCTELLSDLELVIDGKMPSSHMIDVGKSSIAMARAPRKTVSAGTSPRKGRTGGPMAPVGTNRHEPVSGRREGDRRGSAAMQSGKKSKTMLYFAGGIAALGALVFVMALSKGSGTKTPDVVKRDDAPKPAVPEIPASNPAMAMTTVNTKPTLLPKLAGAYYEGVELEKGRRLLQRLDAIVDFAWETGSPGPEMPTDGFSVRWDGFVLVEKPGKYSFNTLSDDGVRLYIDRKLLIDAWRTGDYSRQTGELDLAVGPHAISLEYFEDKGGAFCHLSWSLKDVFPEQIIPQYNLFHTREQEGGTQVAVNPNQSPGVTDEWIKSVQALPAEKQVDAVVTKLKEVNDARVHLNHAIDKEGVWFAHVSGRNIAPLKGFPALRAVWLNGGEATDLAMLAGMALTELNCNGRPISDLTPLRGMKLAKLQMIGTKVSDLSMLRDMPLKELSCDFVPERDAAILKSIATLEKINDLPVTEFWTKNSASTGAGVNVWIKSVQALQPEEQVKRVVEKLKELNPEFDGKEGHKIENGAVVELGISTTKVTNIAPIRALSSLRSLYLVGNVYDPGGLLTDISPLRGLALYRLDISGTRVNDISALEGMPMQSFKCGHSRVSNLAPLKGAKLTEVDIGYTRVADLAPLEGMPLTYLVCGFTGISDLKPLAGMPLSILLAPKIPIDSIAPLAGLKISRIDIRETKVTDLSPLATILVKDVACEFVFERDAGILKSITTLEKINFSTVAEFWKKFPAVPTAKPANVPADATEFQGHWYRLYQKKTNWKDAKARCEEMGGHLAYIESKEEQDYIVSLMSKTRDGVWLGATDEFKEGDWRWLNGQPLTFKAWGALQPNGGVRENYLSIAPAGFWADTDDSENMHAGFMCEWEPAAALPKDISLELAPGVKMEFVLVPAGEFMMGSNDGEANEKPIHKVKISKPYYIGKYEVTVAQWRAFADAMKYPTDAEKTNKGHTVKDGKWQEVSGVTWRNPGFKQEDTHPAGVISWNDAQEFCKWATKQAGRTVRLPSEAEWEFAARGPENRKYPWGDKLESIMANVADKSLKDAGFNMPWGEIKENDGFPFTAPVGSYKNSASWCGAFDMAGNQWEWCEDFWTNGYGSDAPLVDPTGAKGGAGHVLRGACWNSPAAHCRSTNRANSCPAELRFANFGFRAVVSQVSSKTP